MKHWWQQEATPNGQAAEMLRAPMPPAKLSEAAYHGIAGEFVNLVRPQTEADPAAVLVQFLAAVGVYLGRDSGYYYVEGARHYSNLYAVIVGNTAKGRKGTGWNRVRQPLHLLDESFVRNNVISGLASGEGLIYRVRDEVHSWDPKKSKEYVSDPGIADKRLLVVEPEFAKVLRKAGMETSTLSAQIRESWDTGNLNNLTRKDSLRATNAHIAIICHITKDELNDLLTTTEAANGFANRFLWVWSERSQLLPFGGDLANNALAEVVDYLRKARENLYDKRIDFDDAAKKEWPKVYGPLSDGKPGLLGAATGRAETQVCRLALLYAQLDGRLTIEPPHLAAALEVWRYCEDSARYVFGEKLGNDTADTILSFLRTVGQAGATRTEISNLFGRNKTSAEIARALSVLAAGRYARVEIERLDNNPRSVERWFAV